MSGVGWRLCPDRIGFDVGQLGMKLLFTLIALVAVVAAAAEVADRSHTADKASSTYELVVDHLPLYMLAIGGELARSNSHTTSIEIHIPTHRKHPKACDPLGGSSCSPAFGLTESPYWDIELAFRQKQTATRQFRLDNSELDTRFRPPIAKT